MLLQFVVVAATFISLAVADDIILHPPALKKGPVSVMYFAQGADIETEQYRKTLTALQDEVDFPLWVGIAQSPGNIAPVALSKIMDKLEKKIDALGVKAEKTFYAGHSLGGAMTPDYVAENKADVADGVVLMGAFITHKYKTGATAAGRPQVEFPVPTLTIGAELDGLCRLTRVAEALYSQVTFAEDPEAASLHMPVTVVPGMNHMEFASGTAPDFVKKSDLQAEISEDEAQALVAQDAAAFLNSLVYPQDTKYTKQLQARVQESTEFTQPIVDALQMEGFAQFLPPCYCETLDEYGHPRFGTCESTPSCNGGVPFSSMFSQRMMGGVEDLGVKMVVRDSIHHVTETKPDCHHPYIHGGLPERKDYDIPGVTFPPLCEKADSSCELNVTTVTELIYDSGGEVDIWRIHFPPSRTDTGYLPISARELRSKLKSRQAVMNAAGIVDANFTETDEMLDRCKEINDQSIEWALNTVGKKTRERYEKYGQTLHTLEDAGTCAAGPCWIWDNLKFVKDDEANTASVQSVVFTAANKDPYPCGEEKKLPCDDGFHYCKLISPARAVEWMYVDGLRNKLGTKNA